MRKIVLIIIATAGLVAAACTPPPETPGHFTAYITRDGADVFHFAPSGDHVTVSAPGTNRDSNTRTLLWRHDAPVSVDQESCATFGVHSWPIQEGVAVRIDNNGRPVKAVTVMKNVWGHATWVFNVQLVDTAYPENAGQWTHHAALDFSDVLGKSLQPLRLCAKAVGDRLSIRVHPAFITDPGWGNNRYVRTVTLPAGWTYPGAPGIYMGHLPPGGAATLNWVSSVPY